jgi:hypothetical protein
METKQKPLAEMSSQELTSYWNKRMERLLLGKKIVKVQYMSEQDAEEQHWDRRPIQILLNNGVWLTPSSDDEGNDGGSIQTNSEIDPVVPVL